MQNHTIFIIVTPEEIEKLRRLLPDQAQRDLMRAEAEERLARKKTVEHKLRVYLETGEIPD